MQSFSQRLDIKPGVWVERKRKLPVMPENLAFSDKINIYTVQSIGL